MKIYIPKLDEYKIGGGWSFTRNFTEIANLYLSGYEESDLYFITGPTLVQREEVYRAKEDKKKVVLRIDGVPENWRNRGTGWPRLKEFAGIASLIIYQSDFIRDTVGRLLNKSGVIIYNGIDTNIFHKEDGAKRDNSILYVNYRKGEHNKRVEEVIERFRYYKLDHPEAVLTFVGNYSKQEFLWNEKNWDFGMLDLDRGEDWDYLGVLTDRLELANIMRANEFIAFPSFADPCPNTLIEALSCGCKPLWINEYGGQADIIRLWNEIDWSRERMVKEYLESFEKL